MESNATSARPTTIRDLVAVVFRQKWVILTIFGVTTLSVLLLNLRSPTTYESMGRLKVERGRKEASSELLSAICGALDFPLSRVLTEAGDELAIEESRAAAAAPAGTTNIDVASIHGLGVP